MNQILFLCTGNYYRSRVAEIFFNRLASEHGLDWQAMSRGFGPVPFSPKPISSAALRMIRLRDIQTQRFRLPQSIEVTDLLWSDKIIALNEKEHRPTIENQYPRWAERVEYWNVPDIDQSSWQGTLERIEANLAELVSIIKVESYLRRVEASAD